MSGEALNNTQSMPSPLTVIEDWVRGRARTVPRRTPSQLRQLQFHCGNPPPAAEPRTRTRMFGNTCQDTAVPPVRGEYRAAGPLFSALSNPQAPRREEGPRADDLG